MLMQCNYEALEIWEVIDPGVNPKRAQDLQAMSALLHSVPKEMWQTLGSRKTVKEAWEVVQTMRLGADRVKDVNAQKLMKEFKNIQFKDGETIDDFVMRITNLAANLKSLGETLEDTRIVKKFLRVVPPRFHSVVVSIEMFRDLKKLTVEELIGHLRAAEERFDEKVEQITDKAERLLLAEEDWLEKHKHRFQADRKDGGGSGSSGGSTGATSGSAGHWKAKSVAHSDGSGSGSGRLTSEGTPRRKGRYHNCNIYGHWAEDCKRLKREKKKEAKQPEANVDVQGDHGAVLLMAAVASVEQASTQVVHLA
ncbi:uncharacterized protein [Miscanthus floridulus]|uniref:uncharacterized protein n=1 Tax=Miscanthus floridulus TaxID=154761 RepID=UPI003458CF94